MSRKWLDYLGAHTVIRTGRGTRVGHRLHRPQSSQARTQADSVRSLAVGRCDRAIEQNGRDKTKSRPHQCITSLGYVHSLR
jgi:hypothetical protein